MTRVCQAVAPEEGDNFQQSYSYGQDEGWGDAQVRRNVILTGWYDRVIMLQLCHDYFTASHQIKASPILIYAYQTYIHIIFTNSTSGCL